MARIRVADEGGDTLPVFRYDGFNFPDFASNAIVRFRSVKVRSDDIFICAFPKSELFLIEAYDCGNVMIALATGPAGPVSNAMSTLLQSKARGTHWVWELTRLLVAGKLDRKNVDKTSTMIELLPEEDYKDLPSPRILNTHLLFKHMPQKVILKKPRIIYVTRNPKDMVVSHYNFLKSISLVRYEGKWENFLRPALEGKFSYGSWFDYIRDWENVRITYPTLPIITINYEDLQEDMFREAKKLCSFLEVDRTDDYVRQVCELCEFQSMKEIKKSASPTGNIVYRKGEVGDWKNWFTVAQNEWFDQLYQEKMKDCPLEFRYTLEQ